MVDMVDAVMEDTQETWGKLLEGRYQPTRAVLFRDAVQSTCGFAQSAVGPFYCPADRKVYLDLRFFNELHQRFRAPHRSTHRAAPSTLADRAPRSE